jgi:succinate-semialdehyde dehydrogenase / glutarate-semialdehyde dehydrogenase
MSYQSINPCNGELVKSFEKHTDPRLETAIASAVSCSHSWRNLTSPEREVIVAKAAAFMRERADELARLVTLEMGKLFAESVGELMLSADTLDDYGKHAERFPAPEFLNPNPGAAVIENSPLGVIFGVQPWNSRYYPLARSAAPNLMAGNVVMVKHSDTVPQCAIAFEQLWREAGAPAGAYTNLLIFHNQVLAVIDDPRIRGVVLTGGVAAAKGVAERAGRNVKESTMELGGSVAFIVVEDADLDKTITWAVWAKMNSMGQCCIAAKRFIIVEELADQFLSKFKAAMESLTPGDPMHERTTLGPLSTDSALVELLKQVNEAVDHGATLSLGGNRMNRAGSFVRPTILTDVLPGIPPQEAGAAKYRSPRNKPSEASDKQLR